MYEILNNQVNFLTTQYIGTCIKAYILSTNRRLHVIKMETIQLKDICKQMFSKMEKIANPKTALSVLSI